MGEQCVNVCIGIGFGRLQSVILKVNPPNQNQIWTKWLVVLNIYNFHSLLPQKQLVVNSFRECDFVIPNIE